MKSGVCAVATAAALAALALFDVHAQTFPTKPVRIINPAAPGGNSDIFFRLLQPKMSEARSAWVCSSLNTRAPTLRDVGWHGHLARA